MNDPEGPERDPSPKAASKPSKRRAFWYFLLVIPALLGWITVEQTEEQEARHPKAARRGKILGILIVPMIFAGVALFFLGKSEGLWANMRVSLGFSGGVYDQIEGHVCKELSVDFTARTGDARSFLKFYSSGRTELSVDHFDGDEGLMITLVLQADPAVTSNNDMVAQVRFAYLDWLISDADVNSGLLKEDWVWEQNRASIKELSKIVARDMSDEVFDDEWLQTGTASVGKGDDLWVSVPMLLRRVGSNGAYAYDARGRIPQAEMADALFVFSLSQDVKAQLRVAYFETTRLAASREMQGADLGGVMRNAIDAMLAQWKAGIPKDC